VSDNVERRFETDIYIYIYGVEEDIYIHIYAHTHNLQMRPWPM